MTSLLKSGFSSRPNSTARSATRIVCSVPSRASSSPTSPGIRSERHRAPKPVLPVCQQGSPLSVNNGVSARGFTEDAT